MSVATQAAWTYAHTQAMTAGHLKSHQMLLDRSLLLVRMARKGDLQSRDKAQDIVAQLQSSLNLHYQASKQLFEVFGYIWDALEWNENIYFDKAEDLLKQIREVLIEIQKGYR